MVEKTTELEAKFAKILARQGAYEAEREKKDMTGRPIAWNFKELNED
jgi:hypothetical protein